MFNTSAKLNRRIADWIRVLKETPLSVAEGKELNYELMRAHVDSFLYGVGFTLDIPLLSKITHYYEQVQGKGQGSGYLTLQIKTDFPFSTEKERIEMLILIMENYFSNYPQWMKSAKD